MRILTMRVIVDRASILKILAEPAFEHVVGSLSLAMVTSEKPRIDDVLCVFVLSAENTEDGSLLARLISSTLLGIQRYTTQRLMYQGLHKISDLYEHPEVSEMVRAHIRARGEDMRMKVEDTWRRFAPTGKPPAPPISWFRKHFFNGAGDLSNPHEFLMSDPEFEALEKLFSGSETPPEADTEDEE